MLQSNSGKMPITCVWPPSPISAWINPSQTSLTDCALIFKLLINIRKAVRHDHQIFVAVLWEYYMCTGTNGQYFIMKSNNDVDLNNNADIFQVVTKLHSLLVGFHPATNKNLLLQEHKTNTTWARGAFLHLPVMSFVYLKIVRSSIFMCLRHTHVGSGGEVGLICM